MLPTKFQGHRPFGSGGDDFFMVFTIYGHGGHLSHVTRTFLANFRSPIPQKLHMKGPVVSEKTMFKELC